MGQGEVEEFLEENKPKWFTVRQIAKMLGITEGSCSNNIRRSRLHRSINRRVNPDSNKIEYSHKEHQDSMIRNNPEVERLLMEDEHDTRG